MSRKRYVLLIAQVTIRVTVLTACVLWILLHINRRFLCPWLPINPFLLLRLLLIDASAGLSQFFRDIVQTRFRFRFGILTTLSETARYHVLDRVISSRNGLALVFIDFGGPWRRCSRRRRVRFRWLITPGLTLLSHFLHLSALLNPSLLFDRSIRCNRHSTGSSLFVLV